METDCIEDKCSDGMLFAWSWAPFSLKHPYRLPDSLPLRQCLIRVGSQSGILVGHLLDKWIEKIEVGERLEGHQSGD